MAHINVVMTTVFYEGEHLERLKKAFAPAELIKVHPRDQEGMAKALEVADVAVLSYDLDERFIKAPKLKWVHCDHAGLNRCAKPELFERGLLVTSSAGRSAPVLAEHAFLFMLALSYRYPDFLQAQKEHKWGIPGQEKLRGLFGKTAGIIGLGNTGKELAQRCKAFGMKVLAYKRSACEVPSYVDRLYSKDNGETMDELLKESDFIVLALPLSNSSYHLLGEREFKLVKPSAFLINMARGAVVEETAMLNALKNGEIAGAGLDTFEVEPLPPESMLWDAPNTLITPHVTPQVPDRVARSLDIICENIKRYRADLPLLNVLAEEDVFTKGQETYK
jgi:phosphoglycerate dehydrogenase-like enzyme